MMAVIQNERGADAVLARIDGAAMSAVNLQELVSKFADRGLTEPDVDRMLDDISVTVHPHDAAQARVAGLLRVSTRAAGLSLGDRSCLALAVTLDAPVLTADRAWAALDVGVTIEVIR